MDIKSALSKKYPLAPVLYYRYHIRMHKNVHGH